MLTGLDTDLLICPSGKFSRAHVDLRIVVIARADVWRAVRSMDIQLIKFSFSLECNRMSRHYDHR